MAKVGILSMQRIKNYGSFLQAYALKKMIEELGHEVEFVDYHIEKPLIENNQKGNNFKKIVEILSEDAPLKQKLQYIDFKRNYGKRYYDILGLTKEPNYNPDLDVLVIGSDEVFNCVQANNNVGYSLELFGKNNNAKKLITYAASFGNTTLQKIIKYKKKSELSELLSKFDCISVRDSNSGNIIEEITNKKAQYHLDPVLMYDYINECKLIPNIKPNEKYMIVYAYSGRITREESLHIRKYAKENNLKVYALGGAQRCADKFIDCSPFEVLAYFKNAELVVTDTFHGSIFSIITQHNFVTLIRKSIGEEYGNEEKLMDLLNRLELSSRIISDIKLLDEKFKKPIDYSNTNEIIIQNRNNTINYLKKEI